MAERKMRRFNGLALLVAMFREMEPQIRREFQAKLSSKDPILGGLIDRCEFLYQDIYLLDDVSVQKILKVFKEEEWLLAWKLSNEKIRELLLANMSKVKRRHFLSDVDKAPKVPRIKVIKLQLHMANRIHNMLSQGELSMKARRDII